MIDSDVHVNLRKPSANKHFAGCRGPAVPGGPNSVRLSKRYVKLASWSKRFQQHAQISIAGVRRVEHVDVSGSAASAMLTWNYPKVEFTDHMPR